MKPLTRKEWVPPTESSKAVLEARYLLRDESGAVVESPEQMVRRVAKAIARADGRKKKATEKEYRRLMSTRRFLPNSPTLMNAGKPRGQLSACFVLPIPDHLEGIFETLKNAALIHQSGGGTGFSFSNLRARGDRVNSSHGVASGPVSFMKIYDTATEAIKQGGVRRGANMAILAFDHPDVLALVQAKKQSGVLTNFNVSVSLSRKNEAMLFELNSQHKQHETIDKIIEAAWSSGDPGLVFMGRVNLFNPTPRQGEIVATNPCGEQPLLAYESCNLGSLNLSEYADDHGISWDQLAADIPWAVRFLDNVIDVNEFPLKEVKRVTQANRKIGLGVMGFADLLLKLRIKYDSPEAAKLGERVMAFIDRVGKKASMDLAKERGAFPAWKGSIWDRLGYPQMRNATVTTVAPTGTISMIAGCSSGIEPIFSARTVRNVLDGRRLVETHPALGQLLSSQLQAPGIKEISNRDLEVATSGAWSPAWSVSVAGHLRVQAAFQRHSDSAVSKTVNLPSEATVQAVREAYGLALELGCKGITVFRDGSKGAQVLESAPILCEGC